MATSGNLAFDPTFASILDEASERAGIDPATLTQKHVSSAKASLNYMFNEWQIRDADPLYRITQGTQYAVAGTSRYTMPTGAYDVLDMVFDPVLGNDHVAADGVSTAASALFTSPGYGSDLTLTDYTAGTLIIHSGADAGYYTISGTPVDNAGTLEITLTVNLTAAASSLSFSMVQAQTVFSDQPLNRISRQQYLDISDKQDTGDPQHFYVDMSTLNAPTIVVWPVPERVVKLTFDYMRYIETVGTLSETLDVHRPWLEACVTGLALRLAEKYNLERVPYLAPKAENAYRVARRAFSGNSKVIIHSIGFGRSNRTRRGSTV